MDALGSMPGPYVKHFLSAMGCDGLCSVAAAVGKPRADDICALACILPGEREPLVFYAHTHGRMMERPTGERGFGWDSTFSPLDERGVPLVSYAQMDDAEKDSVSARAKVYTLLFNTMDAMKQLQSETRTGSGSGTGTTGTGTGTGTGAGAGSGASATAVGSGSGDGAAVDGCASC